MPNLSFQPARKPDKGGASNRPGKPPSNRHEPPPDQDAMDTGRKQSKKASSPSRSSPETSTSRVSIGPYTRSGDMSPDENSPDFRPGPLVMPIRRTEPGGLESNSLDMSRQACQGLDYRATVKIIKDSALAGTRIKHEDTTVTIQYVKPLLPEPKFIARLMDYTNPRNPRELADGHPLQTFLEAMQSLLFRSLKPYGPRVREQLSEMRDKRDVSDVTPLRPHASSDMLLSTDPSRRIQPMTSTKLLKGS